MPHLKRTREKRNRKQDFFYLVKLDKDILNLFRESGKEKKIENIELRGPG